MNIVNVVNVVVLPRHHVRGKRVKCKTIRSLFKTEAIEYLFTQDRPRSRDHGNHIRRLPDLGTSGGLGDKLLKPRESLTIRKCVSERRSWPDRWLRCFARADVG